MKLFGDEGRLAPSVGFSVKTVQLTPTQTRSTTMFLFPDTSANNYLFGDDEALFIEADNSDRIADDMLV